MATFWAAAFDYKPRLAKVEGRGTKQMVLVESGEDLLGHTYLRQGSRLLRTTYQSKVFESQSEAVEWLVDRIHRKQESLRGFISELDRATATLRQLYTK